MIKRLMLSFKMGNPLNCGNYLETAKSMTVYELLSKFLKKSKKKVDLTPSIILWMDYKILCI